MAYLRAAASPGITTSPFWRGEALFAAGGDVVIFARIANQT